jgi:hypothetical protein
MDEHTQLKFLYLDLQEKFIILQQELGKYQLEAIAKTKIELSASTTSPQVDMEVSQIALWALSAVCTILGWFARELYSATQTLRRDLAALEIRIGTDYVRYDRLQDAIKPIMDSLAEIKHTLSGKADK